MSYVIHGIQHVGVAVPEHEPAWKWYRQHFGLDVPFFNDEANADLMTIYTGDKVIVPENEASLGLHACEGKLSIIQLHKF